MYVDEAKTAIFSLMSRLSKRHRYLYIFAWKREVSCDARRADFLFLETYANKNSHVEINYSILRMQYQVMVIFIKLKHLSPI